MSRLRERRISRQVQPTTAATGILLAIVVILGILVFVIPFAAPPEAPKFILPFTSQNYKLDVLASQIAGAFQSPSYALSIANDPVGGRSISTNYDLTLTGVLIVQPAPTAQPPSCVVSQPSPTSPAAFTPQLVVEFNITCSDSLGISDASFAFGNTRLSYLAGEIIRTGSAYNAVYTARIAAPSPATYLWSWNVTNYGSGSFLGPQTDYAVSASVASTSVFIDGQSTAQRYPRGVFAVISANSSDSGLTTIIQSNMTGALQTIASGTGEVKVVIDTSTLSPGSYLFRASTPGGLGWGASVPIEVVLEVSPLTLSLEQAAPPAPVAYAPNANYSFRTAWSGNVTSVAFEMTSASFTPPPSPVGQVDNTYTATHADLPAGAYTYRWTAVDADANLSVATPPISYIINKASAAVALTLNGIQGARNYTMTDTAALIANITVPGKTVCINLTNGFTFANGCGTSAFTLTHVLDLPGSFMATAYFDGDQNYSSSQVSYALNVNPLWTELNASPASPVTFSPAQVYSYRVAWSFVPTDVKFEFGGSNITPSLLGGTTYEKTFLSLPAGSYDWRWYALKPDIAQYVATPRFNYTIAKIATALTLTLDGESEDRAYANDTVVSVAATLSPALAGQTCITITPAPPAWTNPQCDSAGSATRNARLTTGGFITDYNITADFAGDQNHTASSKTWHAVVVTFNDSSPPVILQQDQSSPTPARLQPVNITALWSDETLVTDSGLDVDVSQTGTFTPYSQVYLGSQQGTAAFVWSDPAIQAGTSVDWIVWAKDIAGNMKFSPVRTFTITQPQQGLLQVNTTPIATKVFANGQLLGTSPIATLLSPGFYTITYEEVPGFLTPQSQLVNLAVGATVSLVATYAPVTYPVAASQAQTLLNGIPTSSFTPGQTLQVRATITNLASTVQPILFAITVQDPNLVPLPPSPAFVQLTLAPGMTLSPTFSFPIPSTATKGTWKARVLLLTDFPSRGGVAVGLPMETTFAVI